MAGVRASSSAFARRDSTSKSYLMKEAIRRHQSPSAAISRHQPPSAAISRHQSPSAAIRRNQPQSAAIRRNQSQSEADSTNQSYLVGERAVLSTSMQGRSSVAISVRRLRKRARCAEHLHARQVISGNQRTQAPRLDRSAPC
jgi:hypothetical protein